MPCAIFFRKKSFARKTRFWAAIRTMAGPQTKPLLGSPPLRLTAWPSADFIRRELVHDLFSTRLSEHSGFYGEMVWVLMMLEHWLQRHAPHSSSTEFRRS